MEVDYKLFYNNEDTIIDTSCYSLFNSKKQHIYDGKTNIWINKKNIAIFPNDRDQLNAINILKSKPGYCIVSRSKLYKYIPLNFCLSINGEKINEKNVYTYSVGNIILSKLPGWKSFLPCTIKSFQTSDGNLKYITLNLLFISCPESELTIAWNYSRNIIPNKSVISHVNTEKYNFTEIDDNITTFDCKQAPFALSFLEVDANECKNVIISRDYSYIPSGFIDKNEASSDKQILKYNLGWVKPSIECFDSKNIFGKKAVTVASSYFSNNFTKDFLPNVRILEPEQFNKIFKIQHNNVGLTSIVSKNENIHALHQKCIIEPQTLEHFKSIKNVARYYMENNNYVTFTGKLCESAKKYLFNI